MPSLVSNVKHDLDLFHTYLKENGLPIEQVKKKKKKRSVRDHVAYVRPSTIDNFAEGDLYEAFLKRIDKLEQIPFNLRKATQRKLNKINPNNEPNTFAKGEALLNEIMAFCGEVRAELAIDNEKLIAYAKEKSNDFNEITGRLKGKQKYEFALEALADFGIEAPDIEKLGLEPSIQRVICSLWWRRKLRVVFSRRLEDLERRLGLTSAHAGIYVSNDSFYRWSQQQQRNNMLIDAMEAINEDGEVFDLKTLIDASVSNPVNRRNELMTRLRGCEEYAQSVGDVGMFYTLTCPSRFHVKGYKKTPKGKQNIVYDNPKFDGSTAKEAGEYLQNVWAKARAKFKRQNLSFYGFRVIEPHHDGTPHWHVMLFCKPQHKYAITRILKSYQMQDCPDEAGAKAHRFKAVEIDWNKTFTKKDGTKVKGSACAYIAKYIAKAIDGFAVEHDLYGKDANSGARRIKAWASTHGFRQFDSFGLPPVGIWRLLRKLADQTINNAKRKGKGIAFGEFGTLLASANSGDYCGFIEEYQRLGHKVELLKVKAKEAFTRYGDEATNKVKGIVLDLIEHITNMNWVIRTKANLNAFKRSLATTWTCVNNCTQDFQQFRSQSENYQQLEGVA